MGIINGTFFTLQSGPIWIIWLPWTQYKNSWGQDWTFDEALTSLGGKKLKSTSKLTQLVLPAANRNEEQPSSQSSVSSCHKKRLQTPHQMSTEEAEWGSVVSTLHIVGERSSSMTVWWRITCPGTALSLAKLPDLWTDRATFRIQILRILGNLTTSQN